MPVFDIVLLILMAVMAAIVVSVLRSVVLPVLEARDNAADRQRLTDLWIPLGLAAPLAAASVNTGLGVRTTGAPGISVPIAVAMIAVGIAFWRGIEPAADRGRSPAARAAIAAAVAGLVLLLLAAANRLSVVVGQVAFAIWAVLLWLNAPSDAPDDERRADGRTSARIEVASLTIVGIAVAQAIIVALLSPQALPVAGGLCALEAAFILAFMVREIGSPEAVRAGLWTAIYGVLLATGLASLSTLIRASPPLREREANLAIEYGLSHGYGLFALEAVLLIVTAASVAVVGRLATRSRVLLAATFILGGACLAGWRLSSM